MNTGIGVEHSCFDGLSLDQQQRLSEVLDDYFNCLEQGCPPDRQDLLARHPDLAVPLTAYLDSLDFLHGAAAGFAPATNVLGGSDDDARPGHVGDFRIVREVGRGGMGVVYEAWQISLDRRVALKVLPFAALLDSKQIARFRNEAQAAAQLHHEHIAPVYAVGVDRGVHYYAMQFIDGQPLDRAIGELRHGTDNDRAGSPSPHEDTKASLVTDYAGRNGYFRTVARMGIQAAEALHAAHEVGIVHRDVKPSNLLLDSNGNVWVTDFGLARCRADANLTRSGEFVGTMRYMSPEQSRGQSHLVDHRTDVYQLGATLYELLTLRQAVRGEDPATILRELDRDQPYRPRLFDAGIPTDLENIVLKSMARSRDERYATAGELAEDLRRFLRGQPTIARPPTAIDRAAKWVRRHKSAVTTAVAMLVLAMVGLVVSTVMLAGQQRQTEQALLAAREKDQQYRAQLALTNHHLALLQDQSGNAGQAEASFQKAIALQRGILADRPNDNSLLSELAATLGNMSFFYARHDPAQAAAGFKETLRIRQRLVDANPGEVQQRRELALVHSNFGSLQRQQGNLRQAVLSYRRAITLLGRLHRPSTEELLYADDLAVCMNNLGMTYSALEQMPQAVQSFREALRILRPTIDSPAADELSSIGGIYNNLGMVLEKQDRLQEAADSYSSAIAFQQRALQLNPPIARFDNFLSTHEKNQQRVLQKLKGLEKGPRAAPQSHANTPRSVE